MSNAKARHRRRRRAQHSTRVERANKTAQLKAQILEYGGADACYQRFLTGGYLPASVRGFIKAITFGDRCLRPMGMRQ